MKTKIKKALLIVGTLFIVTGIGFTLYFWGVYSGVKLAQNLKAGSGGGYWENAPILRYVSGPQRFCQYIICPVPENVFDINGGYSGFPSGTIYTEFKFHGKLSDQNYLEQWREVTLEEANKLVPSDRQIPYRFEQTNIYFSNENKAFILINEKTKEGLLFVG